MRSYSLVLIAAALVGESNAFVSPSLHQARSATLSAATATVEKDVISHKDVKQTIKKLTKDNVQESLDKMEPFLTQQAGMTFYQKSMHRLQQQCQKLGVDMPTDYAKEAKCTEKRREKQNAFIATKEEERLAAETEAAEAAAAASAAQEEEEADSTADADDAETAPAEEAEPVAA